MTYLLDTKVLSETRRRIRDPGVTAWIETVPDEDQCLSALTVGEIVRSVTGLRLRRDLDQARMVAAWLDDIVVAFGERIVPVDLDATKEWGRQDPGRAGSTVDALIGATAKVDGWTLVTRNTKDFDHVGVDLLAPFTG